MQRKLVIEGSGRSFKERTIELSVEKNSKPIQRVMRSLLGKDYKRKIFMSQIRARKEKNCENIFKSNKRLAYVHNLYGALEKL